jgi:multiple sugar transport system ATP-binding protein
MATVELEAISKVYAAAQHPVVRNVSLRIEDGEFMVLLGPSGCGKSTTLRMIAGLEPITSGQIRIDGRVVNRVPARDRDIAMVFQSYALYPHMTVFENMAFGLRRRGVAKADIARKISTVADGLELSALLQRRPFALSGGQRQRVALGRAIVREPKVFLLDEPLSNLDAGLRATTRNELVKLHQKIRTTMIYVTHDQVEAMTMGTRICIMAAGEIVQAGRPMEVYRDPVNMFVARFLGSPAMNLVPAAVSGGRLTVGEQSVDLPVAYAAAALPDRIVLGIRPEDILVRPADAGGVLRASVVTVAPLGAETQLTLSLQGISEEITVRGARDSPFSPGDLATLDLDVTSIRLFDAANERAIPAGGGATP